MARIALISCTSSKKTYRCPARELYSESPRFRLAIAFAKLVANKIGSIPKLVLDFMYQIVHGYIRPEVLVRNASGSG